MREDSIFSRLFRKNETPSEVIASPITGEVLPIEEIADATFAQKLLGDGLAIVPTEGRLYAPAAGTIQGLQKKTGHALCLTTRSGVEILLHIGQDTVKMEGKGFTLYCEEDQQVEQGDLLVEFDIEAIRAAGHDTTSPIVVLNTDAYDITKAPRGPIEYGDALLTLRAKA